MAYVPVPKDLTKVKTKVALNLTKRQLIFFSLAAVVGIPFYLFMRKPIGSSIAAILMVTIMLPFFFMAMYEKDGLPFEKVVANIIRQKFICPAVRPYKTENFYQEISTLVKKEGVPDGKKDKAGGSAGASVSGGKKKPSGKKKQKKQKRKCKLVMFNLDNESLIVSETSSCDFSKVIICNGIDDFPSVFSSNLCFC